MEDKRSLQYNIYKGISGKQGAVQFSLLPAYKSKKKDEGAVFIEAAPTIGPNEYNWRSKIIFALGINDIGKVLVTLQGGAGCEIYHDPDTGTEKKNTRAKRLIIEPGSPGTFKLALSQQLSEEKRYVQLYIDAGEAQILTALLTRAIERILGW